jgi:hypothetical protein
MWLQVNSTDFGNLCYGFCHVHETICVWRHLCSSCRLTPHQLLLRGDTHLFPTPAFPHIHLSQTTPHTHTPSGELPGAAPRQGSSTAHPGAAGPAQPH